MNLHRLFRHAFVFSLAVISSFSASAAAQSPESTRLTHSVAAVTQSTPQSTPRDISDLLQPIIAKHDIPGMAAAIVRGETLAAIGAAGVRAVGHHEKVTTNDLWHIGSCTKSMTATMIAALVEDGTLAWDTRLFDVFPRLEGAAHESWKSVTLAHLLTNRSGASGSVEPPLWATLFRSNETPAKQRLMLLDGFAAKPTLATPGTKNIYSNQGFAIAGAMAERATGSTWESLMRERLFHPLGMNSADFGPPGLPGVMSQPRGHDQSGKPIEPTHDADNPAAISPAGRVHCTIADWAKYVSLHLRASRDNPNRSVKLLRPETFERLHTVPKGADAAYGFGWAVPERAWAGGAVLTHNGSNTMWFSVTWIAPKKDFAVLVCCNKGGASAEKACDEASSALIRHHLSTTANQDE